MFSKMFFDENIHTYIGNGKKKHQIILEHVFVLYNFKTF